MICSYNTDALASFVITQAFQAPEHIVGSPWAGHIPFMQILISTAKPRRYVELGVYRGCSFLTALSAAKRSNIAMDAFGVDAWTGDAHSGFYDGQTIFTELEAKVKPYGPRARLIRSTFDDAVSDIPDGTIDILHIDGLHTYEAVKRDFELWRPKVSDAGIVLFHDTNVRRDDFGVWKFWEEIEESYPTLSFQHSHGLGVALVGPNTPFVFLNFFTHWNQNAMFKTAVTEVCEQVAYAYPDWYDPFNVERAIGA